MAGVDNRIVTMQFDNRSFEQNARTSLMTLQKLKESMSFGSVVGGTIRGLGAVQSALSKIGLKTPFAPMITAANKGLSLVGGVMDKLGIKNPFVNGVRGASELQKAAQAAGGPGGMGVLEGGVTAVSSKFIALSTIAITALSNITNRAINAGTNFAKSFTFAPVMDGLREYETNLKSIQTIQANTDRPLTEINRSLDELNQYSDLTIYNFGEMARNIGTFTAAGVDLQTSVSAIKGIANMAALSGSSSQQAASAMYQLSQALASGKVSLMDWNSVVNAGMGGKKLQNALAQTAAAMGELDAAQIRGVKSGEQLTINGNSFRESIMSTTKDAWLSSKVLENTLASLDGRYSVAARSQELLADGTLRYKTRAEAVAAVEKARNDAAKKGIVYTDEQFKALQKLSTSAFESATKVKTLGQVFDIAKETIASGWSASFRNIFGNLKEAKSLFTGMSNGLNDIIKKNALARNNVLAAWKKGGGRDTLIDGLKNSWEAILKILGPIRDGFRDIFPAKTADDLISITERFKAFTERLIPSKETMADIRDIAGGVFAVFGIGKQLLDGVVTTFKTMFDVVGGGNGKFLDFAGGIGNAVKRFNDFLAASSIVTAFFEGLGKVLAVPLALIRGLAEGIGAIFRGFDAGAADKIGDGVDAVGRKLSGLEVVGDRLRGFFQNIGEFFGDLGGHIADALMGIGDVVARAFTPETFSGTLDVINTTLLGGLVLLIKSFFNKGVNIDLSGGLFDGIKETLGEATSAFQNMQNSLKADILLKLAAAIGVMALSLLVLSGIDPKALGKAMAAMTGGFGVLVGAMAVLMKVLGTAGLVQLYVITSAMTKMAASILLLSFALKTLAGIDFGSMLRGMVGLAGMMFILSKAMIPLAAGSKGMGRASASLILVAVAVNILAVALKILATLSWEEMARGLVGLAGMLLAVAVGMKAMPDLNAEAVTLVALGIAMNLLAISLKIFATMSWTDMAKGLLTMAAALGIISVAMRTMPKGMLLQAVALNGIASSIVILSGALKIMGAMSVEEIGKGLITLGAAIGILAIGLNSMGGGAILGATALTITTAALIAFVPVLATLGNMSIATIVTGLLALAGVFTVLGLSAWALAPLTPVIIALSASMLVLGAGLALAGAGALAAATAFGIVVSAGAAGAAVITQLLTAIIRSIPPAMAAFGKGVVQFAVAIGQGAPKIAAAFGKILSNLIDQVIRNTPKLGRMFLVMLNTALNVISQAIPRIINVGMRLIISFLEAINRHIPRIIDLASSIIVKFINGIARNLGRIIQAGVNLIIKFIEGMARAVRNNSARMGEAGADLALALVEGAVRGIGAFGGRLKDAVRAMAKDAWDAAMGFFKTGSPSKLMRDTVGKSIPWGMAVGIRDNTPMAVAEVETMGRSAIDALSIAMRGVEDAFAMDPNFSPVVAPVLDLTKLSQDASKMNALLAATPIVPTVSYASAANISALTQATTQVAQDAARNETPAGDTYVTYEQHLHSPVPLDSVRIYRDGKSLIAMKKEALTK